MELLYIVVAASAAILLLGLGVVWAVWRRSRAAARSMMLKAEEEARRINARAEIDAQRLEKDAAIQMRERLLAARTEFERETREHRLELDGLDRRLGESETELDQLRTDLEARAERVEGTETQLADREIQIAQGEAELEAAVAIQKEKLEQIAGLTAEQAKGELLKALENEARMDAAGMAKRIEDEATEKAKEKARRIISMAIQRIAAEHVVESTVSVVDLPSDEMKGRIIGRESNRGN